MIKLSIIVPVYNGELTLKKCLDSIIALHFPAQTLEVIVVNNNSTDQTEKIVQEYPFVLINEKKQGRAHARNAGGLIAKGDILAFVDSDCILDSNWANELIKIFDFEFIGAGQGAIIPSGDQSNLLDQFRQQRVYQFTGGSFIMLDVLADNFPAINSAAFMIRKKTFSAINGFDTNMIRHEDVDLANRVFAAGFGLSAQPKAVAHVYWHGGSWTSYLARSWDMGRSLSLYQLKWGNNKPQVLLKAWVYFFKRFLSLNFFSRKILLDFLVTTYIEISHLLAFHFYFIPGKWAKVSKSETVFQHILSIQLENLKYQSKPHFRVSILSQKIVVCNILTREYIILTGEYREYYLGILNGEKTSGSGFQVFISDLIDVGYFELVFE